MTLSEIAKIPKQTLTIAQVSDVLDAAPQLLRLQIREDKETGINSLGFPTIVTGTRIKIPKIPFLEFMGWKDP
ncbi:hypothetical protein ACVS9P_03560 [Caproicibacterium sp. NSD3]